MRGYRGDKVRVRDNCVRPIGGRGRRGGHRKGSNPRRSELGSSKEEDAIGSRGEKTRMAGRECYGQHDRTKEIRRTRNEKRKTFNN